MILTNSTVPQGNAGYDCRIGLDHGQYRSYNGIAWMQGPFRTKGWHQLKIEYGANETSAWIDDYQFWSVWGNLGFNAVQIYQADPYTHLIWDDFAYTPIPEPASILALVCGLGSLVLGVRGRK